MKTRWFSHNLNKEAGFALIEFLIGFLISVVIIGGYFLYKSSFQVSAPQPSSSCSRPEESNAMDVPVNNQKGTQIQNWPVYENEKCGFSFQYPPYFTIEYISDAVLPFSITFIGKECAPTPAVERGHTPELFFSVNKALNHEVTFGKYCGGSPHCRSSTIVGPIPLNNGLEAQLEKTFGVSGDGTSLIVVKSGLELIFTSYDAPLPCGNHYSYNKEIFQMANTLTFIEALAQYNKCLLSKLN